MIAAFRSKVDTAIARVEAMAEAERRAIFTEFDPVRISAEAEALIARHAAGEKMALFGTLVSVKDLYDEAGQVTAAGSRLLSDQPPASRDAVGVARLRAAGALMFGRTSMSEFAYSGVGLNPHHGTPSSVLAAGTIPGGSSSGGAVTVGLGLTDAALGTDTGGSLRIPAAANGLWGIKPTQGLIDDSGVHALAPSFDTPGPMAADPDLLRQMVEVMAATALTDATTGPYTLAVPVGAFTNGLSPEVEALFAGDQARLRAAGHELQPLDLTFLGEAIGLNRIIVAAQAHRIYASHLTALETAGDPRVLSRIRFAETLSPAQVQDALAARAQIAARFDAAMAPFDAAIAPTLMRMPPTIAEVEADFDALNAAMLRNTSLVNLADGCALAMPTAGAGGWSMTMLVGRRGTDARLFAAARAYG
ncbi:amidase family protein [Paracoccus shanxieyensis]|uniref:Glutamyl-tRNA amidotransferase n=1 Tax=Paracoccus shanxieyensis TaxID=2675752 RepID=A0A6L6IZI5_9RHOB|nr:amidase family protein [Paracoccus shanxieyensis]MTH65683.1 glutamyl-tRNA amidotransferase [Paracoccus shanxieyensis]MTH88742.1 glutamyl-tRNA amidotransferase [Paracoccus shanxieyensis]